VWNKVPSSNSSAGAQLNLLAAEGYQKAVSRATPNKFGGAERARSGDAAVSSKIEEELIRVANDWDRAMVTNDAEAIGRYMADDWIIIGPDGRISDRPTFLELVKSAKLSHDVMESDDFRVRVYGDTAVVTARGVSGGKYQGQAFREVERSSCVFVRQEGQWRCVLTHLSRLAQPETR
jgi:ketosteroid isomerase-like protein